MRRPPSAGGVLLPPPQREVWGDGGGQAPSFPADRATSSASLLSLPAPRTPGASGGAAGRAEAVLLVPRLGTSQPKGGDSGPAVGRLPVLWG